MKIVRSWSVAIIACFVLALGLTSTSPAAAADKSGSPFKTPRVITAPKKGTGSTKPVKDAVTAGTTNTANAAAGTDDKTLTTATGAAVTTVSAVDQTGKAVTVKLADVSGLTSDWLTAAGYDATKSKVKVNLAADGKVTTFGIYDTSDSILAQYDPSSHLMQYYYTDSTLKGKLNYVTSDSKQKYTWLGAANTDPSMGKDGNVIVQKYSYDDKGNVASIQYYAFTAGVRKETGEDGQYSRYIYRTDTFVEGKKTKTEYFNDPRPTFWEPTLTGKVSTDAQGRIFLTATDGKSYLLTARKDGFDADGDGKVGADEMSATDWDSYVGKDITVRGHQIAAENESDIYLDGKKAEMFGVVDVVKTDKGEKLIDGWDAISEKVSAVMAEINVGVGTEKDINKVYDQIYAKLADALKDKGISTADITKFADASMKTKWADGGEDLSQYTDSESLLGKAWEYAEAKNWDKVKLFADEVISRYTAEAKTQQASLKAFAPEGKEADYWALNDVATAHFILGTADKSQGKNVNAKKEFDTIISDYKYAQCYDPDQDLYWEVADAAREELVDLPSTDTAQSSDKSNNQSSDNGQTKDQSSGQSQNQSSGEDDQPSGDDQSQEQPENTDQTIDFSQYTDSQSLVAQAWANYTDKDWAKSKAFSEETIQRYEEQAREQQESLSAFAPQGEESKYWALNDVATSYYILAMTYRAQGDIEKAAELLKLIISKYGYAQCYDPEQKLYWKVAEAAQKELDGLE